MSIETVPSRDGPLSDPSGRCVSQEELETSSLDRKSNPGPLTYTPIILPVLPPCITPCYAGKY